MERFIGKKYKVILVSFTIFLQNCTVIHSDIKEPTPLARTEKLSTVYRYELFNWITKDNGELSRNVIKGMQENAKVTLEYGHGSENYIQIILDREPGSSLISSNVIAHPDDVVIRILNRILTVASFTIIPYRIKNERVVTVNFIQNGKLIKQKKYETDYQVFIGLGAFILLPWSDKDYIKNDMLRIGNEIGKEF